jgi:glycosyltransferase involved in cell wall biosynthesis
MPTFDRPAYLRAALDSVLAQTFRDWELIIADDGSGPETQACLRSAAADPRVKVLWLAHTGNPPAVRNVALREASGEYVAFLDSDDVWLPEKLATQIAALRSPGARPWSYTGFTLVDAAATPLTGAAARPCPAINGPFLEPLLKGEPMIVQSSVVARRVLIERAGGYDDELPVCGDYALWIRLAQSHEIDLIPASLVLVRRHKEHYSDEIAGLEDLRLMFAKVRRSGVAAHLTPVLRRRRARVAAGLARSHSLQRSRLRVLRTVLSSAHYSWRYRQWWGGALAAMARAFAPAGALQVIRKYRAGVHAKTGSPAAGRQ